MSKRIDEILSRQNSTELKRTLETHHVLLLGIGGIIGAGIFVLTGQAAASYAGPAIVLSFLVSALGCVFAAMCYAELAALIPVAGSAYTYASATLGRLVAWIIGWDLILEYLFGASTVAVGWSGYVASFLKDVGMPIPPQLATSPFAFAPGVGWSSTGALVNLPAMLIVGVATYFLVRGISESAKFNNIVVFLKLSVILLFIFAGLSYVKMENLTPFIPENTGQFGEYGISGIFRGAGVIFFAYIGFDSLSTLAQEAKNPQRSMPIGIVGSLLACTILYVAVAFVMTGMVPYKMLNDPAPIAIAVNMAGDGLLWLRPLIKLGAIAGLSSVVLVLMLAQPRIFYAMSKDGLLPPVFAKVHHKFGTAHISSLITGGLAAVIAGFVPIGILGELVSIGTLFAFVIVCAGVIVLRRTDPDRPRPFRTPMVPLIPILGIIVAMAQMLALPHDTWIRLFVWLALGLAIYFCYGRKRTANSFANGSTAA